MAQNSKKIETNCSCHNNVNTALSWVPLAVIKTYRYAISPLMGSSCRFYPTCSAYAEESYRRFGFIKGTLLTSKRILRCHPWHEGGYDPVPEVNQKN